MTAPPESQQPSGGVLHHDRDHDHMHHDGHGSLLEVEMADVNSPAPSSASSTAPTMQRRSTRKTLTQIMFPSSVQGVVHNIFRTKTIEMILKEADDSAKAGNELKKCLGLKEVIFIGCGCMIGAGIFVLSGIVAKEKAGPGVILSYVVAGICALLNALAYAEFAARIPVSGSSYLYAYTSCGELIAFILSFQMVLEYTVGAAVVARGWSTYMQNVTGGAFPQWLISIPINGYIDIDFLALVIIILLVILICFGAQESAMFNNIVTSVIVVAIIFSVIVGSMYIDVDNYEPFLPFGTGGIFAGAASVFFSYIGFDAISTCSEEVKRPQRDLPIGIVVSLTITTSLYCALAFVLVGMVSYSDINIDAPLAYAFDARGLTWAKYVVSVGALSGLTTTVLVLILSQPRIYLSLARDGLVFPWFGEVHPRFKTPVNGTLFTGILSGLCALLINIEVLSDLVSIGTLFAFALVSASTILLRYRDASKPARFDICFYGLILSLMITSNMLIHEIYIAAGVFAVPSIGFAVWLSRFPSVNLSKSFRCPGMPWVPVGAVLSSMYLMFSLDYFTWIRFLVWTVLGLVFYFAYGYRHSKLHVAPRSVS